ncbi:MAG TPA: protease pro-enzyme activation domain-containing protein, partial [Myxococcaceae bacterium]|nr:protease pro-enzyme activation domain-containing protein [Myxococcaceae bacterium]
MPTKFRRLCALGVLGAAVSCGNLQKGSAPLARGVHPLALPQFEVGPLAPEKRLENLSLVFKLSPEQEQEREALLAAQLDPASPSYHRWLTSDEYAARFGAKPGDIERAKAWLTSQGLELLDTSRLGARVRFGGTVAQIQAAFHSSIRQYQIGDELHYAMPTAPMIPTELAEVVLAVQNTHD